MTDIDIMGVLNYRLSEYTNLNPIDVDYPNIKYEPSNGTSFLAVDLLPGTTTPASIGTGACTRHVGVYQIMINVPKYKSFSESKVLIDGLKNYFRMSTGITYNGITVRVTKFQVEQYMTDDAWFKQPVSIYYRSDLENT